jgi:alanyl-tRNA synthetase
MIDVKREFQAYCRKQFIEGVNATSIASYDTSTLFCPAGMQRFTEDFKNPKEADQPLVYSIQACLRTEDLDQIGDGIHFPYFHMLGTFSFAYWTVFQAIDFWMHFLGTLGVKPTHVTIHPEKMDEWKGFYAKHGITDIRPDEGCIWTAGDISGYCTEFYVDDVEIGNIVNPGGNCIDVGFGAERISNIVNHVEPKSGDDTLRDIIGVLIKEGIKPGAKKQEYILRKLLRLAVKKNLEIDHTFYAEELNRLDKMYDRYVSLKHENEDKSAEWWWSTHGIDLTFVNPDALSDMIDDVLSRYPSTFQNLAEHEKAEKENHSLNCSTPESAS